MNFRSMQGRIVRLAIVALSLACLINGTRPSGSMSRASSRRLTALQQIDGDDHCARRFSRATVETSHRTRSPTSKSID